MFNRTGFKEVCESSGFSKKELAVIYGTTRQTIYDWLNKGSEPKQLALVQRADCATTVLLKGMRSRLLPLSPGLSPASRSKRIDAIIKTIMESMKPGKE